MYLKLTNDHTASFYNNELINAEPKECCFKFNPCHYPGPDFSFCFEADITDDLRSFLKRFGVDIDETDSDNSDDSEDESIYADEAKLKFYLYNNGDIGPCS